MRIAFIQEPPFNDVDPAGNVVGCDIDLARYVCAQMDQPFDPIATEFSDLLPGLVSRKWRMTTGLFATEERQKTALFSRPVWALPDGLLVQPGNPLSLTGYRSVADRAHANLAVIKNQAQHKTALSFGIPNDRIKVFTTYAEAAAAIGSGRADAYASVARAHAGFMHRYPEFGAEYLTVPEDEKPPAFGCFAVNKQDRALLAKIDDILERYIGTSQHREMMARYGFTSADINLVLKDSL